MHGAGFILDSINRMKSNRSLVKKDRGAFDINEHNGNSKPSGRKALYKKASPEYLKKLRIQIKNDKAQSRKSVIIRLLISAIFMIILFYLAYGMQIH